MARLSIEAAIEKIEAAGIDPASASLAELRAVDGIGAATARAVLDAVALAKPPETIEAVETVDPDPEPDAPLPGGPQDDIDSEPPAEPVAEPESAASDEAAPVAPYPGWEQRGDRWHPPECNDHGACQVWRAVMRGGSESYACEGCGATRPRASAKRG